MSKLLVDDALWTLIAPLLPPEQPKPKGGRPRIADRAARTGILFVLQSGIPWEMLLQELGCDSDASFLNDIYVCGPHTNAAVATSISS